MGDWGLALESAEQVLEVDKNFVKAILVKAESLYNTCDFEHALIYYHRGQVPKLWFTLVLVLWMSRTSQQIISLTRLFVAFERQFTLDFVLPASKTKIKMLLTMPK